MHKVTKLNALLLQAHRLAAARVVTGRGRSLSSGVSVEQSKPPPRALQGNQVSLFGPKDRRLPLPGDVGIPPSELRPEFAYRAPLEQHSRHLTELDIYGVDVSEDRQRRIYTRLISSSQDAQELSVANAILQSPDGLDCQAQECPLLLKKDFQELFPQHDILTTPLIVITVTQRIKFDSSLWNEEIGTEREQLTENFISMARQVVRQLNTAGYWADFIDPSSGRTYLNPANLSDATLFETDERYRNLGFTIDDLGCCKVITHHKWGHNAFVGSLFTNAPIDSPEVQRILARNGN
ncbi:methylmalonic aciduria and homocystinuria type D -like protein [Tropilaelaps mercedesae]|uniref:Methylmalonic aciduria and homocystinuria type D-like protein n=1 Tax=Tropilaelaps mercedesae TaxID=418985 RepID=A0A1V9Y2B0_9ACAR|nr:methylmalonic aciduria and homocystinuria type D -like protein [Tropilaelaps mercedesae]